MVGATNSHYRVAREILVRGPLSRKELSERLDLSEPSVSRFAKRLIALDLIAEIGQEPAAEGRPRILLDISPATNYLLGIKLSADTAYVALTNFRGLILQQIEIPIEDSRPHILSQRLALIIHEEFSAYLPHIRRCGVSLGGRINSTGIVAVAPFLSWNNVDFGGILANDLGIPVDIENDVKAFTQAVSWFTYRLGVRSIAVITVGSGVSSAFTIDGEVIKGTNDAAGSVGHLPLGPNEIQCEAGHYGCARTYLATSFLEQEASAKFGRDISIDTLLSLDKETDPRACKLIDRSAEAMGMLVSTVISLVNPERVIISGEGVSLYSSRQEHVLKSCLKNKHWTIPMPKIDFLPFTLFEWAKGAAAVAVEGHLKNTLKRI